MVRVYLFHIFYLISQVGSALKKITALKYSEEGFRYKTKFIKNNNNK